MERRRKWLEDLEEGAGEEGVEGGVVRMCVAGAGGDGGGRVEASSGEGAQRG